MFRDLSQDSSDLQTSNCALIQCTVWPRYVNFWSLKDFLKKKEADTETFSFRLITIPFNTFAHFIFVFADSQFLLQNTKVFFYFTESYPRKNVFGWILHHKLQFMGKFLS